MFSLASFKFNKEKKSTFIVAGKGIKVESFKVDKCLGVGHLGRQKLKTRRPIKIVFVT
jgi:hypothetical protein